MSKLLRRLGTKALKFQIDLKIVQVELKTSFPCELSIQFRRGNHKIETKTRAQLDKINNKAVFNETLNIIATLYYDTKRQKYQEKIGIFTVVINTPNGNKKAGTARIDISQYLNQDLKETDEIISLQSCPDKQASIHFQIKIKMLGEVEDDGQISETGSQFSEQMEDANEFFTQQTKDFKDLDEVNRQLNDDILRKKALMKAQIHERSSVFRGKEKQNIEAIHEASLDDESFSREYQQNNSEEGSTPKNEQNLRVLYEQQIKKIQKLEEQYDNMQQKNQQLSTENQGLLQQIKEYENKLFKGKDIGNGNKEYNQKILQLESIVEKQKQELMQLSKNDNLGNFKDKLNDVEAENTKLCIENENLKSKLKDALNKINNQKNDIFNNTILQLQKDINNLKTENQNYKIKIEQLNSEKCTFTKELENLKNEQSNFTQIEEDLCKTKQLLGDIMNLVFEEGGGELVEKITNLMMQKNKEQ